MQKHLMLTALGLLLGLAALALIEPDTKPGAVFLVFLAIVVVNAAGALVALLRGKQSGSTPERGGADAP